MRKLIWVVGIGFVGVIVISILCVRTSDQGKAMVAQKMHHIAANLLEVPEGELQMVKCVKTNSHGFFARYAFLYSIPHHQLAYPRRFIKMDSMEARVAIKTFNKLAGNLIFDLDFTAFECSQLDLRFIILRYKDTSFLLLI